MYKRRPLDLEIRAEMAEDARSMRTKLREVRKVLAPEAFAVVRAEVYGTWRRSRVDIVTLERDFHRELAFILERAKRLIADRRQC